MDLTEKTAGVEGRLGVDGKWNGKRSATSGWTPKVIYTIAFLDLFAVSMLSPLIRQQSLKSGSSYTIAGLIGSVYGFCQLFSGPLVGDWSDHAGRGQTLFVTSLLSAFGYFLFSVSNWIPLILFSRVICGVFKHTQTLCKASLADFEIRPGIPDKDKKNSANKGNTHFGTFMAISNAGFVLGPTVGGHIAEQENGFQTVATLTSATFLTIAVLTWIFFPKSSGRASAKSKEKRSFSHASEFKQILRTNWDVFLLQLLVSMSIMIIRTNYVQYVQDKFGMSIKWAGYLTSFQALLGVIGSAAISTPLMNYYQRNELLVLHSTLLTGISMIVMSYTSNFIIYVIAVSVQNFVAPFSRMAHMNQLFQRSRNPDHHGALMGTSQSVGSFCRLSSSVISGIAQDYYSHGPEILSVVCTMAAFFHVMFFY